MPRTFTRDELLHFLPGGYDALSPEDQAAFDQQLTALWANPNSPSLSGDYDRIGSYLRAELGE